MPTAPQAESLPVPLCDRRAGNAVCQRPGLPHRGGARLPDRAGPATYMADEKDPWEYTWIEIDGLRVSESLSLAGLSQARRSTRPRTGRRAGRCRTRCSTSSTIPRTVPSGRSGSAFLFLDQLVQSSAARRAPSQRRLRDFYMKEALSFIEQNYQRDISIEDIAAFCGLNRSYFGKVFGIPWGRAPRPSCCTTGWPGRPRCSRRPPCPSAPSAPWWATPTSCTFPGRQGGVRHGAPQLPPDPFYSGTRPGGENRHLTAPPISFMLMAGGKRPWNFRNTFPYGIN